MYVLASAIGVEKGQNKRYKAVSIGAIPMNVLFNTYRRLFIHLTNTFATPEITIELESLRAQYSANPATFTQFLTNLGNQTLATTTQPVTLAPKYVKYSDAFRAQYKVKPVNILNPTNENTPRDQRTSLRFERPLHHTDMELFYKNCLVSVNGFLHRVDYDGTYAYGVEAAASQLKSHQNQVGVMSFRDVGEIETVALTDSMIFAQNYDSDLKTRIYIKLNKDLTNKTVMMSLGGYLIFLDGTSFWQTGSDVFALNLNRMPYLERYFESEPYLNLDALGLPVSTNNPDMINVGEFMTDTVIKRYLKLPQTFMIILDSPEFFRERIYLKQTRLPGMFIGYHEPTLPLIVSNGRMAEYWKTKEDTDHPQWAINVHDSYLHKRVFSTVPISELDVISDADVPEEPYENSNGYLLQMGKDF